METRTEKYAKYRESIKNTPDDQFPGPSRLSSLTNDDFDVLSSTNRSSSAISYVGVLEPLASSLSDASGNISPYDRYKRKKKAGWIIKVVFAAVLIAALIVYYFLGVK